MALLMATRRAAASSNSLGRLFRRKPHLSSPAAPSTSCFVRYFSDSKDCKRSDKFAVTPGINDPQMQNPFQTSGTKRAYEVKQVEEGLFLRMEMPGIGQDDVKILADNNDHTLHVKIKVPPQLSMIHQKMEFELKNGVLRMMIPKSVTPMCNKIAEGDNKGKAEAIHDDVKSNISSHDVKKTQKQEAEMESASETESASKTPKYPLIRVLQILIISLGVITILLELSMILFLIYAGFVMVIYKVILKCLGKS